MSTCALLKDSIVSGNCQKPELPETRTTLMVIFFYFLDNPVHMKN